MAKGVKKIKWVPKEGDATVFSELSKPNKLLTIEPDKWVWFEVSEWEAGTTDAEKKKKITWMKQNTNRREVLNYSVLDSDHLYAMRIAKKLCGVYTYYVEASLLGKRDFKNITGLKVRGYCQEKIVKSFWTVRQNSSNERENHVFSYGEVIYLQLETEGLNGSKVIVDVYNMQVGADKLVHTYNNVAITDGEVNLKITNSTMWRGKIWHIKDEEKFYVKVKSTSGKYISDGKDTIHARFLKIKDETVPTTFEKPSNQTPLKIDKPDLNVKNYHPCRYEKIIIYDPLDTPITLFAEGKTFLKNETKSVRVEEQEVFFDFNKHTIRPDAQIVLDDLLKFLLSNEHLHVSLSGHADDRGELDYNQHLSEKRADEVRLYLFKKGLDKTKFNIAGYGEVRPKALGNTEDSYQKNRRVDIKFSYVEYNAPVMVYETIASSYQIKKKIKLKIEKRKTNKCFRDGKEKHTQEIVVKSNTNLGPSTTVMTAEEITHEAYSYIGSDFKTKYLKYLINYLNPLGTTYNSFLFYINTCAYYANKNNPTLQIKVYPDVVWIGHFQYNYAERGAYFFHDKQFALKTGISDVIDELTNSTVFKFLKILPSTWVLEALLQYIKHEAMSFTYGIHVMHERSLEKRGEALSLVGKEINLLIETKYTKYAAAAVVYYFVMLGIIIDLVMIYLTRGKNLTGRVAKIAKKVKILKKIIDDTGVEIVPPSIAINAGMYYKMQLDGRLALIYEANVNINPLIAINFIRDFDLIKMLQAKPEAVKGKKPAPKELDENKNLVLEAMDYIGIKELKGTFTVVGELALETNVKVNVLTNTYDIKDKLGNLVNNAKATVTSKEKVKITIAIFGKFENEFKFFSITKVSGEVSLTLSGSATLQTTFKKTEGIGLSLNKKLIFTGIKGVFTGHVKVKNGLLGNLLDFSPNGGKPIPFTLIEPHDIDFGTIQLFNQS